MNERNYEEDLGSERMELKLLKIFFRNHVDNIRHGYEIQLLNSLFCSSTIAGEFWVSIFEKRFRARDLEAKGYVHLYL